MRLQLRSSQTATGKPELVVGGECDWHEFPSRAQAVVDHFRMNILEKIDGVHERMWIVSHGDAQFCISWDTQIPEVSIIAWKDTPGTAVERLGIQSVES